MFRFCCTRNFCSLGELLSSFVCYTCLCEWVCLPPGNFDLFSTSNGTSKEDFSEFDNLRSSSSVPTGTHPVFVHLMTRSVCFSFPRCLRKCPSADVASLRGGHRHTVSSFYKCTNGLERRQRLKLTLHGKRHSFSGCLAQVCLGFFFI